MIIIDTSALLAILLGEEDEFTFEDILVSSDPWLPVSCYLEASINLRRHNFPIGVVDNYIRAGIGILALDERQARIAAEADRRYGRGTGHPARLNFGDCLAYAAAVAHDAPLLFKGADFGHTDVKRVV